MKLELYIYWMRAFRISLYLFQANLQGIQYKIVEESVLRCGLVLGCAGPIRKDWRGGAGSGLVARSLDYLNNKAHPTTPIAIKIRMGIEKKVTMLSWPREPMGPSRGSWDAESTTSHSCFNGPSAKDAHRNWVSVYDSGCILVALFIWLHPLLATSDPVGPRAIWVHLTILCHCLLPPRNLLLSHSRCSKSSRAATPEYLDSRCLKSCARPFQPVSTFSS